MMTELWMEGKVVSTPGDAKEAPRNAKAQGKKTKQKKYGNLRAMALIEFSHQCHACCEQILRYLNFADNTTR